MIVLVNLVILIVLFGFLFKNCFCGWSKVPRVSLSLITGINIYFLFSSISYFLALNLSLLNLGNARLELLLLVSLSFGLLVLLYLGIKDSRQMNQSAIASTDTTYDNFFTFFSILNGPKTTLFLKFLTGLSVIVVLVYCVSKFYTDPHGEWDAWAIWNLKARFLYRAPDDWLIGFSSILNWSHPDYPLFLPSLVAKFWALTGNEALIVSHLIAAFYLLASAYVMFSVITKLTHANLAYLAVILLFSSYTYIRNSVFLTADIPLANLLLISVCFFCCYLAFKQHSMLIFAFLFLSGTVWTKNEGQLIFLIFMSCYVLQLWRLNDFNKSSILALVSVLPSLITFWLFKGVIVLDNDLFAENSFQAILNRALDISRYQLVIASFFETIIDIFKVNILFVIALLFYFRRNILNFDGVYLFIAVFLCVMGYLSIYLLITPHDLAWHLQTSIERILLHFYPTFILLLFLLPLKSCASK